MAPTRPWEVVAIDICGPFPTTPNKNRYLLTFLDHLTKYAEAIPITSMTAENVPVRTPRTSLQCMVLFEITELPRKKFYIRILSTNV